VQLRFEGVDAPELHYGTAAQLLGVEARDHLLSGMGFRDIQYAGSSSVRVEDATPAHISGVILSKAADVHGRPISYAMLEGQGSYLRDGEWIRVDQALLEKTLNFRLLREGVAYYLAYTSLPFEHRQHLRQVATAARDAERGVWKLDMTSDFLLESQESIGPDGQLIFPKLFRRCTDYLKAVKEGFRGNLQDWLIATSQQVSRDENDRIIVSNHVEVNLSDLLDQRNRHIVFQADLLDIVFVEK
jgi:Staphylococcal nuclease homologue